MTTKKTLFHRSYLTQTQSAHRIRTSYTLSRLSQLCQLPVVSITAMPTNRVRSAGVVRGNTMLPEPSVPDIIASCCVRRIALSLGVGRLVVAGNVSDVHGVIDVLTGREAEIVAYFQELIDTSALDALMQNNTESENR